MAKAEDVGEFTLTGEEEVESNDEAEEGDEETEPVDVAQAAEEAVNDGDVEMEMGDQPVHLKPRQWVRMIGYLSLFAQTEEGREHTEGIQELTSDISTQLT